MSLEKLLHIEQWNDENETKHRHKWIMIKPKLLRFRDKLRWRADRLLGLSCPPLPLEDGATCPLSHKLDYHNTHQP